jgi:radical SAM superfamily enzyme YgiQ (UPF0313 family)
MPKTESGKTESGTRRLLLVYPKFPGGHLVGYEYMVPMYPMRRAVMPPLGLLTFAGCLPPEWEVRLVDENVRPLRDQDIRWADAVLLSGMHPQRHRLEDLIAWANRLGKLTVLGGPSVSICPEYYPEADILHVGELGDATEELIQRLSAGVEKPERQVVLTTREKTPLDEHPLPAIQLVDVRRYIVMPVQFSVGCPYNCDFCDIPIIYGRRPRVKSPERLLREFDALYQSGFLGALVFVDDNLMAKRREFGAMLPELVEWQRRHGYPFAMTGEVSVDLAPQSEILGQMRDARFTHLFFGVETVDQDVLCSVGKRHNARLPMAEALQTVQSHGIEILMGIIFGFDGEDEAIGRRIVRLIEETRATLIYFNLLAALPKTPLWTRMEQAGRLVASAGGDRARADELLTCSATNLLYDRPNEQVVRMMRDVIREVYSPEAVYRRITWNAENVYGKQQRGIPPTATWSQRGYVLRFTLGTIGRVFWRMGVCSPDRRYFWRFAWDLMRFRLSGRIGNALEILLRDAPHAHHLIQWGRQALASEQKSKPAVSVPSVPAILGRPAL